MRETRVRSLGREDPPEKEMATHSSIHASKIPWTELVGYQPWVAKVSDTTYRLNNKLSKECVISFKNQQLSHNQKYACLYLPDGDP